MATRLQGTINGKQLSSDDIVSRADRSTTHSPHTNPYGDPKRENFRTYPYDYYSGGDCKVFYGDIWVDDILSIQYSVSQNKTPIYGYASQNFNSIAKGRIIVEGTLVVAFKETGYLNIIQRLSEVQKGNAYDAIKKKVDKLDSLNDEGMLKFDPKLTQIGDDPAPDNIKMLYSSNGSPQIIRQEQTIEEILVSKKASNRLSSSLLGDKDNSSRDFEDFAEILEDSIWGDANGKPFTKRNLLKRPDEFDYNPNGGITVARGQGDDANYGNVLNIMLTFGDITDFRAEHTMVVLNDVHFTNSSMIVSQDGSPIAESYTFFARDINQSITSEVINNIDPIKLDVGVDGLRSAKIKDINAIEKKLSEFNSDKWTLFFRVVSQLTDSGWSPVDGRNMKVELESAKNIPLGDKVIEAVEGYFNESILMEDIVYSQYVIDAYFPGTASNEGRFTLVLEQAIPNTRTYRVISPARTGFTDIAIYTRDDLLIDPPKEIVEESVDDTINDKNVQRARQEISDKDKDDEVYSDPEFENLTMESSSVEDERQKEIFQEQERAWSRNRYSIDDETYAEYERMTETTPGSEYGVANTSSELSHLVNTREHALTYGDESGITAIDIGNLGPKGEQLGYAPAAFSGRVLEVGNTWFTTTTADNRIVTYRHVSPSYTRTLERGTNIYQNDTSIYYTEHHYQVEASLEEWEFGELEYTVNKNLGIGYRNTSPTPYFETYSIEAKKTNKGRRGVEYKANQSIDEMMEQIKGIY